ncbi:hypothetical protein TPSD3_10795 [Thioflexithrix psekupsensis]|uniref:Uncharacterized protein n=1 Tax=Thioflexithrix psekupsensis TaxID=1570016 RepID=A0A251X5V4_9GAMM|nr:hypothetical protein TPSD3_10795 [Thioflexithrix psekupsensis]
MLLLVGLGIGAVCDSAGAVVSTVKLLTANSLDTLPAASVTLIVQLLCVPSLRLLKVTVLLPTAAAVVVEVQLPL